MKYTTRTDITFVRPLTVNRDAERDAGANIVIELLFEWMPTLTWDDIT
jgi:hypothetical protein